MKLQEASADFATARNWQLDFTNRSGFMRNSNLIIHPNGRLYGELAEMGFQTWRLEEDHLIFQGRHEWDIWEFERQFDGDWIGWPVNISQLTAGCPFDAADGELASSSHQLVPLPELAVGKDRFEIVVAKLREDIAWTECYARNVTIYSKEPGDAGVYPVLPNFGKDAGTQLHHIVERYDGLAERTLFLQGHPWDHPMLPIPQYATDAQPFTSARPFESRMDWSPRWTKSDQPIDEPVMRAFLALIGCDPGISSFRWTQGMQVALSREQVCRRPCDFYRQLLELSQRPCVELAGRRFDNHHVIYLFELFWREVFRVP